MVYKSDLGIIDTYGPYIVAWDWGFVIHYETVLGDVLDLKLGRFWSSDKAARVAKALDEAHHAGLQARANPVVRTMLRTPHAEA